MARSIDGDGRIPKDSDGRILKDGGGRGGSE
jgi:hypothetical protein